MSFAFFYKKSLVVGVVVACSLVVASAQTNGVVTPPSTGSSTPVALIIADVNLVNATSTEKDGMYTGGYSLIGRMGQQNGIGVGIIVYDAKKNIVDEKMLVSNISIKEGELRPFTYSYTVPKELSGKVTIILRAQMASGLPLGYRVLGEKKMSGSGSSFTCSLGTSTSSPEIICVQKQSGILSFTTVNGSLFSIPSNKELKTGNAAEKITFTPNLSPGKYYALLTQEGAKETIAIPFRVAGTYGAFLSSNVSDNKKGGLRVITASKLSGGVVAATVEVQLTSKDGANCGIGKGSIVNYIPVVTFDVTSLCKDGMIALSLIDGAGKVLDSRTEAFEVSSIKDIPTTQMPVSVPVRQSKEALISVLQEVLLVVMVLAIIGGLLLYIKKRRVVTPIVVSQ